jgi:O-antigen/teichoic acid export membrane protein
LCFGVILLFVLIIVGFVFFNQYGQHENVTWGLPWLLLAITTALNLLLAPIMAYMEGLGKVKEIAKIRLCQQCVGLGIVWSGLFLGAKLYVIGINGLIGILLVLGFVVCGDFRKILYRIWSVSIKEKVSYKKEIFPYQWKIALSWISGYFIFQLFNPVLFATEGAVVAGQMGMTLAALHGIQSLSMSWMTTKVPLYSGLIAQKNYIQLDTTFNRTLKQSTFINGNALLMMLLIIYLIRFFHIEINGMRLGNRFLDYAPMLLMMIPLFINQFVFSWATYLRCHKQEPFLVNSIVMGILCCLSTVLLGQYLGALGITGGYCFLTFTTSFWGYWIFKTKKHEWHEK